MTRFSDVTLAEMHKGGRKGEILVLFERTIQQIYIDSLDSNIEYVLF